jgi:hypothetical protein
MGRYTHADKKKLAEAVGKLGLPGNEAPSDLPKNQLLALVAVLAALVQAVLGEVPGAVDTHRDTHPNEKNRDASGYIDTNTRRGIRVVG